MVLPDSNRVPRVPLYSGAVDRSVHVSSTGLSPSLAGLPRPLDYAHGVQHHLCRSDMTVLQPVMYNAGRLAYITFGLFRVRSPLLAESLT